MRLRLEVAAFLCVCVAVRLQGIIAASLSGGNPLVYHQLEDNTVELAEHKGQPRPVGRWHAVLVPVFAALLLVLAIGLCAGRKQQLNINEDGESDGEASGGILSCCQTKVLNKEPSILPQDSYAVRGPSTQNLASTEPVLLSPDKPGNASNSSKHPSTSVDHGTPPEIRSPAIEEADDPEDSQPVSFLGKTFASFNIMHSKWRNKAPPDGEPNKSLSRSLENLSHATAASSSSGGGGRAARSALKPAMVPPPVQSRPRAASKPTDADQEAAKATQTGYEPVELRPSARERQKSHVKETQQQQQQQQDADPSNEEGSSKGAAQPLVGMLKRLKKPSTGSGRKAGNGAESSATGGKAGDDKPGHPAADGSEARASRTVTIHPAPCELAYNQVTVQPKPGTNQEVQKQRKANQAYAISGPLKTPPPKAKPPLEIPSSAAHPTTTAASSASPPSPVHRKRALSAARQAKKSPKLGREQPSASAMPSIPSSDYETIVPGMMPPSRPGQPDPLPKKEPLSVPSRNLARFHDGSTDKAAPKDPDHDYDEPDECASKNAAKKQKDKQPQNPKDVYSVVDKKPAPKPKDVHGAGDKSRTAAVAQPAPTDLYSVVDKKQKQPAPAPTDLYSVVDKKAQQPPTPAPAPTEVYSSISKRQADEDKLVYTQLAFQSEQQETTTPTSPTAKKSALPAPATVYEQIDIDVHADAAKLPRRTTAGLREDDSDYEDIEGATMPATRPGRK